MQRNNLWHPSLKSYAEEVCRTCDICLRTGEPLPSRKISIPHIDCQFNTSIGVDFFYWQRSYSRTVVCLHVMCMGTMLSEAKPVDSRDMKEATRLVESLRIHNHGRPVATGFDPEFNNVEFLSMLRRNGVTPQPRPARRHNKLGRIERKHRTIKRSNTAASPLSQAQQAWTHQAKAPNYKAYSGETCIATPGRE